METHQAIQIFFQPGFDSSQDQLIHSSCYRLSKNILQRAEQSYALVEITALNYMALIEPDNICFADLSRTETHQDLQGSPVTICWKTPPA